MLPIDCILGGFLGLFIIAGVAFHIYLTRQIAREKECHIWRPAVTSRGPARTCICGETQQLTTEEFYAQFGIMPNVGIIAK